MFKAIRNTATRAYSTLSSGPQGVEGRMPGIRLPETTTSLSITDPFILYQNYILQGLLEKDELQLRVMKQFQKLYYRVVDYSPPEELLIKISLILRQIELKQAQQLANQRGRLFKLSQIHNFFGRDLEYERKQLVRHMTDEEELQNFASPHGLLINGEVGCGKSMLMDIFAASLPHKSKMRWHYNNFILWVFNEIHNIQQQRFIVGNRKRTMENEFILFEIAQKMISKNTVLMLDEFMLPDIASANIIKLLFTYYFKLGGVLVATSNKLPEELYANEFHKKKFKSFVGILNSRCVSVDLRSEKDYREFFAEISSKEPNMVVNTGDTDKKWVEMVKKAFEIKSEASTIAELGGKPSSITVYNRTTIIPFAIGDVAYLEFDYICQGLYSSSDYITLASQYRTIVLDNVPIMTTKMKNEARRFITLLDAIYEAKCQFYMRCEVDVDYLFFPDARKHEIPAQVLKKLDLDSNNSLEVQDEEMFAKTSIAMTNPYRPNTSTYDESQNYDDLNSEEKLDYKDIRAFTGEDEKFAYKRAVLRIKEMVCSEVWSNSNRWVPVDLSMRPWESLTKEVNFGPGVASLGPGNLHQQDAPKIKGGHHFWAMGPWTSENAKRIKDEITRRWIRTSIRN